MQQQVPSGITQLQQWVPTLLVIVTSILTAFLGKFSIARWLTHRRRDDIFFINRQLKESDGLSHQMQTHLKMRREALLFRVTTGIQVSASTAKEMVTISEDYPGGLSWSMLKNASPYLTIDEHGKLLVKILRTDWVFGLLMLTTGILFAAMGVLTSILFKVSRNFIEQIASLAVAALSFAMMLFFVHPFSKIISARRVAAHLKGPSTGKATASLPSSSELKGAVESGTLIRAEKGYKIAAMERLWEAIDEELGVIKGAGGAVAEDKYMNTTRDRKTDLAVYSVNNVLQLIIEVKGRSDADAEWAAALRRNLFVNEALPSNVPYFLIATPYRFFLWRRRFSSRDTGESIVPPDYTMDAEPFMSEYIDYARQEGPKEVRRKITGDELTFALIPWLIYLINSPTAREDVHDSLKWLFDSGLYDAIEGGRVETEALV